MAKKFVLILTLTDILDSGSGGSVFSIVAVRAHSHWVLPPTKFRYRHALVRASITEPITTLAAVVDGLQSLTTYLTVLGTQASNTNYINDESKLRPQSVEVTKFLHYQYVYTIHITNLLT